MLTAPDLDLAHALVSLSEKGEAVVQLVRGEREVPPTCIGGRRRATMQSSDPCRPGPSPSSLVDLLCSGGRQGVNHASAACPAQANAHTQLATRTAPPVRRTASAKRD